VHSEEERKSLSSAWNRNPAVQPVAHRCTDFAVSASLFK
jgi:hypothetical protein